ncbi:VOC family protein [Halobium salinum]|uniref:VOC family protein n=1 Tax=Halobium salinum TaxID=1364940 RepID=A0ABD5PE01_9EURY|nr:VOC family protein [Halobium salinum]
MVSDEHTHDTPIAGLGEIALRVDDLDAMATFYEEVVGLRRMERSETMAFFDVAAGVEGHTQILALFDRSERQAHPPESGRSTLDHFAFGIPLDAYEDERERLRGHGIDPEETTFEWVSWRSLFFYDPEGNHVELVAYDPDAGEAPPRE